MSKTPKPRTPIVAALIHARDGHLPEANSLVPVSTFSLSGDSEPRLVMQEGVLAEMVAEAQELRVPGDGAYWRIPIILNGPLAALDAADKFAERGDLTGTAGSTLYGLGEAVAHELRRRILHNELVRTGWNLSHVADRLRMKGPPNVLAAIRTHGLEAEYEAAKVAGHVAGKSRKKREPTEKK